MRLTVYTNKVAGELARERMTRRGALLDEEKTVANMLGKINGPMFLGKDENGQPVPTRPPAFLKMKTNGLFVEIKYRREETGKVDEAFVEGMAIPRKYVKANIDVFSGVRSLKHVREGYEHEFKRRDAILTEVEKINAELAHNGNSMDTVQLDHVENMIERIVESISKETSVIKKLGKFKAEEILEYLEKTKTSEGFEKQQNISAACAKLVAFRNRYGEWRDKQVAKIMAYNKLRECSLRAYRDQLLVKLLKEWADEIAKHGYGAVRIWKRDMENAKRMDATAKMIENKEEGTLARIVEIGKRLNEKYYVEKKAREELRHAYANLKELKPKEALADIAAAKLWIEGGKAWKIAQELEKTADPYMKITVSRINVAVDLAMEKNHVIRAGALFEETAEKM